MTDQAQLLVAAGIVGFAFGVIVMTIVWMIVGSRDPKGRR